MRPAHEEIAAGVLALVMGGDAIGEEVCTIACGAALLLWHARAALVSEREAIKVVRADVAIRHITRRKDQHIRTFPHSHSGQDPEDSDHSEAHKLAVTYCEHVSRSCT